MTPVIQIPLKLELITALNVLASATDNSALTEAKFLSALPSLSSPAWFFAFQSPAKKPWIHMHLRRGEVTLETGVWLPGNACQVTPLISFRLQVQCQLKCELDWLVIDPGVTLLMQPTTVFRHVCLSVDFHWWVTLMLWPMMWSVHTFLWSACHRRSLKKRWSDSDNTQANLRIPGWCVHIEAYAI